MLSNHLRGYRILHPYLIFVALYWWMMEYSPKKGVFLWNYKNTPLPKIEYINLTNCRGVRMLKFKGFPA
jgi:hypothetical protein